MIRRASCAMFFTLRRSSPSARPRPRPTTPCISASSIASTTRLDLRPRRARISRRMSKSGCLRGGRSVRPRSSSRSPGTSRRRRRHLGMILQGGFRINWAASKMQTSVYNMDPRDPDPFPSQCRLEQRQPRPDPAPRGIGDRRSTSYRLSDSPLVRGGFALHPRRCSAKAPSPATTVPLVSPCHRQRRRHLEYLAELPRTG